MSDWLQFMTFALNLLILPVLKWVWDVRSELVRMNGKLQAHDQRLERLERRQDTRP